MDDPLASRVASRCAANPVAQPRLHQSPAVALLAGHWARIPVAEAISHEEHTKIGREPDRDAVTLRRERPVGAVIMRSAALAEALLEAGDTRIVMMKN